MDNWKLVPVEPTEEMLKPLYRFMRPEAARELLKEVLTAAQQPPALGDDLDDALRDMASSACQMALDHGINEDVFVRLARSVRHRIEASKPPALGGEPEVVAEVVNKYGEPAPFAQRGLLHRTDIDKLKIGTELVDRAHVDRLQAEVERLKTYSKKLAELDDSTIKRLGDRLRVSEVRTAELEALLRKGAVVVEQFMPNVAKCSGVDFQAVNEFLVGVSRIDAAMNKTEGQAPKCAHEWLDDGQFLLVCTACGAQEDHDPHWRDPDTAPKNGTMLRLLVEFDEHSTEDDQQAVTIGHNSLDNTGDDEWQFAGWCWSHDHYTQGKGTVVGWLPLMDHKATEGQRDE